MNYITYDTLYRDFLDKIYKSLNLFIGQKDSYKYSLMIWIVL